MNDAIPLWPEVASKSAVAIDYLSIALFGVSAFFSLGIAVAIIFFVMRYWHTRRVDRVFRESALVHWTIEITWMTIPLLILLAFFVWGGALFVQAQRPPDDPILVHVVGKQWMWKIAHQNGRREINTLHVPSGRPVRLTMTSEDVIHSFYIPAFRKKQDVLPGRLSTLWFEATRPGTYHLFCAEYCGTSHSQMVGQVIVQSPEQYAQWLSQGYEESQAQRGRNRIASMGCLQCHGIFEGKKVGPPLTGLLGRTIPLADGTTVTADRAYIRRSMIDPQAQIHAGYEPVMPTYQGRLGPQEMMEIIAYIRSVADASGPLAGPGTSGSPREKPGGQSSAPEATTDTTAAETEQEGTDQDSKSE